MSGSKPLDFLNREILVGKLVVYPGRQGSHLWMNVARVEKITRNDTNTGWKIQVRRIKDDMLKTLRALDRIVVLANSQYPTGVKAVTEKEFSDTGYRHQND